MNFQNYGQAPYQGDKSLKQTGNGAIGRNCSRRHIVRETNNSIIRLHGLFCSQKFLKTPVPETAFGLLLNDHDQIGCKAKNHQINGKGQNISQNNMQKTAGTDPQGKFCQTLLESCEKIGHNKILGRPDEKGRNIQNQLGNKKDADPCHDRKGFPKMLFLFFIHDGSPR